MCTLACVGLDEARKTLSSSPISSRFYWDIIQSVTLCLHLFHMGEGGGSDQSHIAAFVISTCASDSAA